MPDEKGETRREKYPKFGQSVPDIEVPDEAEHVWGWFWALSARRRSGPEAITYSDIGEWQRLTCTFIRPEEVEMLMRMDDEFLRSVREEQRLYEVRQAESAKGRR